MTDMQPTPLVVEIGAGHAGLARSCVRCGAAGVCDIELSCLDGIDLIVAVVGRRARLPAWLCRRCASWRALAIAGLGLLVVTSGLLLMFGVFRALNEHQDRMSDVAVGLVVFLGFGIPALGLGWVRGHGPRFVDARLLGVSIERFSLARGTTTLRFTRAEQARRVLERARDRAEG